MKSRVQKHIMTPTCATASAYPKPSIYNSFNVHKLDNRFFKRLMVTKGNLSTTQAQANIEFTIKV